MDGSEQNIYNNNSYASINKKWWEKMVKDGCGFTKPWLNLNRSVVQEIATKQPKNIPAPINEIYPTSTLSDVEGKNVLCLAAGGGQQSAVFGLLGATVTVVDIAEGQLNGDKKAAEHYGYEITTIQTDMCDLSAIKDNVFDLVYQAPSMTYVPAVRKVYSEVARVIKSDGFYRSDAENPLSFSIDDQSWDGKGYRINKPYSIKQQTRSEDEDIIEFRHYLSDFFNGLIEQGFVIKHVEEMPAGLYQDNQPKPNTWGHSLLYAPGSFTILARKK